MFCIVEGDNDADDGFHKTPFIDLQLVQISLADSVKKYAGVRRRTDRKIACEDSSYMLN